MAITLERLPGRVQVCDWCKDEFVFARTVASERGRGGKAMPLNVVPDPDGRVAVNVEDPHHLRARALAKDETHDVHTEVLATPHFATCTRPRGRRQ